MLRVLVEAAPRYHGSKPRPRSHAVSRAFAVYAHDRRGGEVKDLEALIADVGEPRTCGGAPSATHPLSASTSRARARTQRGEV